jgi:hypothetical protein
VDDPRVRFHKGWFEDTLLHYQVPPHDVLFVALDADLYSSTRTVLNALRTTSAWGRTSTLDEFSDRNHELRAFDEFIRGSGMKFRVVGATASLTHVVFQRVNMTEAADEHRLMRLLWVKAGRLLSARQWRQASLVSPGTRARHAARADNAHVLRGAQRCGLRAGHERGVSGGDHNPLRRTTRESGHHGLRYLTRLPLAAPFAVSKFADNKVQRLVSRVDGQQFALT